MDKSIDCTQILPSWNLGSVRGYLKGYRGTKGKLKLKIEGNKIK